MTGLNAKGHHNLPALHGWVPDWPVPAHVHAFMSTRVGGVSAPPFDGLNLGTHVRDDPAAVQRNRQLLARGLQAHPVFLSQVHGTACVPLDRSTPDDTVADACLTQASGVACTVMVADCLPVLLTDTAGRAVAAAHAGWRGLAGAHGDGGVLAKVVKLFSALPLSAYEYSAMNSGESVFATPGVAAPGLAPATGLQPVPELLAWLGPCIGPTAFEVGEDVRAAFIAQAQAQGQTQGHMQSLAGTVACFQAVPGRAGKYLCNLAGLARLRLAALGVTRVFGNDGSAAWCTVGQPATWFSHRRDAALLGSTGRMAACVWLGQPPEPDVPGEVPRG